MSNIQGPKMRSKKITATVEMVTPVLTVTTEVVAPALKLDPVYTVATVPPAADNTGRIIVVTDGGAGNLTLARSTGAVWARVDGSGLNIA